MQDVAAYTNNSEPRLRGTRQSTPETLSGSMIPFVLKRFGIDPATSSAPFVATLVDVTGLLIYFSIAAIVLRGTLL